MTFAEFRAQMVDCAESDELLRQCIHEARDQLERLRRVYLEREEIYSAVAGFEGLTEPQQGELRHTATIAGNTAAWIGTIVEEDGPHG